MLSQDQLRLKKRVFKLWTERKRDLHLTQIKASQILDLSQPAFSMYMTSEERMPINTDFVRKFAAMLKMTPVDIDPSLEDMEGTDSGLKLRLLNVVSTLSGIKMEKTISAASSLKAGAYGLDVDIEYSNLVKGQTLVIDPHHRVHVDDRIVLEQENGFIFGTVTRVGANYYISYTLHGNPNNKQINAGDTYHYVDSIRQQPNTREAVTL